jgi:hypothetical protein
MFYGLTSGTGNTGTTDYAATIAVGTFVPFPRDGPTNGSITRSGGTSVSDFVLPNIGTYQITWQIQTTEPGQFQVNLDGVALPETTSARQLATSGGCQIMNNVYITTSVPNAVVRIQNPAGNSPALTVTPASGSSTWANAPNLTIRQLL